MTTTTQRSNLRRMGHNVYTCNVCGYVWLSRLDRPPVRCPSRKCTNPFAWQREKVKS